MKKAVFMTSNVKFTASFRYSGSRPGDQKFSDDDVGGLGIIFT
jgi:hypothetical protein